MVTKHGDSLRHQLDYYLSASRMLVDRLFDPAQLPTELMGYRQRFYCQRLLSLFRALYLAGRPREARRTYHQAIRCRPQNLLRFSYLRKYLRLLLRD